MENPPDGNFSRYIHILCVVSFYLETLTEAIRRCGENELASENRFRFLSSHYKHLPSDLQEWTSSLTIICKELCFMHVRPAQSFGTLDDLYLTKWQELKTLVCVESICENYNASSEHRKQFFLSFNLLVRELRALNSMHISSLSLPSLEVHVEKSVREFGMCKADLPHLSCLIEMP
jgi:hypothetical protein